VNREPVLKPSTPEQVKALKDHPIECATAFLKSLDRKRRRKYGEMARRMRVSLLELITGYDEASARRNVIAAREAEAAAQRASSIIQPSEPKACETVGLSMLDALESSQSPPGMVPAEAAELQPAEG
jgi:hypothetical protein